MKLNVFLAFLLCVPNHSLLSQELNIIPKTTGQKWFARITNNFSKLPRWFTLEWFKKVPKTTWNKVKNLFGGFELMTIVGILKNSAICRDIYQFDSLKNEIAELENEVKELDQLYDLFVKNAQGDYEQTKEGAPIFKSKKRAKAAIKDVKEWLIPESKKDLFIGAFDSQVVLDIIDKKYKDHKKKIRNTQLAIEEIKRKSHVKKYAETGVSDCKEIGSGKIVAIILRDYIFIVLMMMAAVFGIIFAPEIYGSIKEKLKAQFFAMQPSQNAVPDCAPSHIKEAENICKVILSGSFDLPPYFSPKTNVLSTPLRNLIDDDMILYYAELYPNISLYFHNNLPALRTKIQDISSIGLVASTPYIKDQNRMRYIRQLLQANIVPTDTDKKLVNLLAWKLKKAYWPQMKGMKEFLKQFGTQSAPVEIQKALPPAIMNIIKEEVYPEYVKSPFQLEGTSPYFR